MKNLEKVRLEKGLTQEELAFRSGCSRITIWSVENGKSQPRVDIAKRIADALGVTLDQLM